MEHVPSPRSAKVGLIHIPYICLRDYDGGDFLTYPQRSKWSIWGDLVPFLMDHSGEDSVLEFSGEIRQSPASFLQNWCFFGLLWELSRVSSPEKDFSSLKQDFTERRTSGLCLSTTELEPLLSAWIHSLSANQDSTSQDTTRTTERHMFECLTTVQKVLHCIAGFQGFRSINWRIPLAIVLLEESISYAFRYAFPDSSLDPSIHTVPSTVIVPQIGEQLIRQGWCPKQVAWLSQRLPLGSVLYLWDIPPPESSVSHENCSSEECAQTVVDVSTYKTLHVSPECACDYVYADQSRLAEIIKRGSIPILMVSAPEHYGIASEGSVQVIERNADQEYVAISHVWAQGLGNHTSNALPLCQLLSISEAINDQRTAGDKPIPFWIDTMCCPREPKELRALAISRMRVIYEQASWVLVIDKYLRESDANGLDFFELLMRILICQWQMRLWTYQEACLASKLLFRFGDGAVDLPTLYATAIHEKSQPEYFAAIAGIVAQIRAHDVISFRQMLAQSDHGMEPAAKVGLYLNFICNALNGRSTSVLSDEYVCAGALLDMPTLELFKVPEHQRHLVFWSIMENIPAEIIFSSGPNLQQRGFGWAPATFLGNGAQFAPSNQHLAPAKFTQAGLEVEFSGFLLHAPRQAQSTIDLLFCFRCQPSKWYIVQLLDTSTWWSYFPNSRLALIEQFPPSPPSAYSISDFTKVTGQLAQVIQVRGEAIFVKLLGSVLVSEASAREAHGFDFMHAQARGRTNIETTNAAEFLMDRYENDGHRNEYLSQLPMYHGIEGQRVNAQKWCVV